MIKTILVLLVAVLMMWCRQSASFTEKEKVSVAEDVRRTLNNYYNDIRKSGLNAEFDYLDHSPEFFWVPPGYHGPISYDSIAAILKKNEGMFKMVDNSFDSLLVIPVSKKLATYFGRIRSVVTDTAGKVRNFSLVETGIVIKRKDGWKLLQGQTAIINE